MPFDYKKEYREFYLPQKANFCASSMRISSRVII